MGDEAMAGAVPLAESALILSGPGDTIFDDIWDWIQNAVYSISRIVSDWVSWAASTIASTVTSWISWLLDNITSWFSSVFTRLIDVRDYVVSWVATQVNQVWYWISTSVNNALTAVGAWFSEQWSGITGLLASWFNQMTGWWNSLSSSILSYITTLGSQIEAQFTWLGNYIRDLLVTPLTTWWDQFLDRLLDVGSWIGSLLDGIAAWFMEDVPGHSPKWTAIFETIGDWFMTWFVAFPTYMFENFPEKVAYGLSTSLKWVGETFNSFFETFMEAIMGIVRQIGQTNPTTAVSSYSAMAKVGMTALGGTRGMTIAGETLNPISHLGLGHISAMIYDMTNYKVITGVFMGALTFAMLRQPLTYYFNDMFRPFIIRQADFMELMARDAWSHPELLRVPALISSVRELTRGDGAAFENKMIGYYGFPGAYYGLFKELSFAPLRYFPLAGIARAGFWDEAWFTEALSRSGYSPTAREALMDMYREQVLTSRQLPVMYQVKRLSREGFATMAEINVHLEKAAAMETLTETRLFAMELEQEFSQKEMAFDIIMRSFSRGIIPEGETREGLAGLGIPGTMLDLHLMREKLGLLRRISIPAEAAAPPLIGVEE